MRTVAIAGVGLIGGSFGLALRAAGFEGSILGISSPATIEIALARGAITRRATLEEAVATADLLYLSQPVAAILDTLLALRGRVRPELAVTDAGSTKAAIVRRAGECLAPGQFLGGHPLAGKEQSGIRAADANLFRDRPYVLTAQQPSPAAQPTFMAFSEWLRRMGARVIQLDPVEHDRAVARTSHLPQLLATTLAALLDTSLTPRLAALHGNGLVDMTRLALSPADLWSSIFSTNRDEIERAIAEFVTELEQMRAALKSSGEGPTFERARRFAERIRAK